MRALVTGHAGFIGQHIWSTLQAQGWRLDGWERHRDARNLIHAEPEFYDLVVHCAAMVDGREAIEHRAALLGAYNLQLDGALFEWALRARPGRIVYFSSSAAYPIRIQNGDYAGHRLTECDLDGGVPDATYGWVKLIGEQIAREARAAGIPVTVVRPFSGYGENQANCYPFPAMMARAKCRQKPFKVWGDGTQVRDFIHVDDVVAAVLALADAGVDGPVNLGTGVATSMDALAGMTMRAAGYMAPIKHLPDKPAGVQYRVADTSTLQRYYEPQVTLEEGVRRALEVASRVYAG